MVKKPVKRSHSSNKSRIFNARYHLIAFSFAFVLCAVFMGVASFFINTQSSHVCANSISCIQNVSGLYEPETEGEFNGKKVSVPTFIADAGKDSKVLGNNTGEQKRIFVDLSQQKLYAFEGKTLKWTFPVSTGKWSATPTGDFRIWIKLRYTRMAGGNSRLGTYYNLPNVPYTMYFANAAYPRSAGYSLHGTYWHDNFGHPMSHGCVNMRTEDVAKIYEWADPQTQGYTTYSTTANPGTLVTIYGTTPKE